MTYPNLSLGPALAGAALLLCSCATSHRVAFDEAALAHYRGSGSGVVKGKAFLVMPDGSKLTANHLSNVTLMPRTPYTDEIASAVMADARRLQRPDPRFANFVRTARADDKGRFAFTHLPTGDYYVGAELRWTYADTESRPEGGVQKVEAEKGQWLYHRCTVRNGQITNIKIWNQGNVVRYR